MALKNARFCLKNCGRTLSSRKHLMVTKQHQQNVSSLSFVVCLEKPQLWPTLFPFSVTASMALSITLRTLNVMAQDLHLLSLMFTYMYWPEFKRLLELHTLTRVRVRLEKTAEIQALYALKWTLKSRIYEINVV